MKTVFGSLPFYNSTDKQDVNRTKAIMPIHCPRTQLPPFQFDLDTDTIATVDSVELIDRDGNKLVNNLFNNYSTVGFTTFTATGLEIKAASTSVSAIALLQIGTAYEISVTAGDEIEIQGTLNLISGSLPHLAFTENSTPVHNETMAAGDYSYTYTVTSSGLLQIELVTAAGSSSFTFLGVSVGTYLFNNYFQTLPQPYTATDTTFGVYLKYNGTTLNYLLPLGVYYVKITGDGYEYISDYISVDNIYGNLILNLTNSTYETFTKTNTTILSAVNSSGSGFALSGAFDIVKGESVTIVFYYTAVSGTRPTLNLIDTGWTKGSSSAIAVGLNVITLTATWTGDAYVAFYNNATTVSFSTSEVYVQRAYSSRYTKIHFRNTDNFGNLLYEQSQAQTVWLEAVLNNPTHEIVNVGQEKDGIFIAEKITSKLIYTLIGYVSRAIYQCLMRLPQHDSITITDEVGNTYTPAVGNVTVEPPEWTTYETTKIVIRFNDNTSFSWTT